MSSEEPEVETSHEREKDRESAITRWSGIVLMVAILAVAGILSALTAMRFAIRGREVVVPPLVGKTEAEAQKTLEDAGLILKVTSKRFSTNVPEGHVVEQI